MFAKTRMKIILLIIILALAIPMAVYADGGSDNTPAPDISGSIQLPDQSVIDAAQQEKLAYLPITAEQDAKWEKAFEQQMMGLQQRLSPEQLQRLDIDSLSRYIDMQSLQKAAGVTIVSPKSDDFSGIAERSASIASSSVDLGQARHGDFLLGHGSWRPWGYWNHAGVWDAYHGSSKTLHARGYGWGVRHDASNWFKWHYSKVAVMGVWSSSSVRVSAANYARAQEGEPYTLFTSKTNQSKWYCSKLVWAGYYWRSGHAINLDPNGGFWVTPNNLWYSGWTYVRSIG